MIDTVIFSRNRPLQLFALLESLHFYTDFKESSKISVIFKYDDEYLDSLQEIREKFSHINFINQGNFKQDVVSCLEGSNRFCTFFVDDIVFKRSCAALTVCGILDSNPGILTFSLRMGTHLNYCYPTGESQPIPDGNVQSGFFIWDWRRGSGDWGYPISVDGHVFRKDQFLSWLEPISFNNPNQFEDRLQIAKQMAKNFGCVCMTSSCIVNLPINRVQDEYKNKSGEELPENLKKSWDAGQKIDFLMFSNINNSSAHFPSSIRLVERI